MSDNQATGYLSASSLVIIVWLLTFTAWNRTSEFVICLPLLSSSNTLKIASMLTSASVMLFKTLQWWRKSPSGNLNSFSKVESDLSDENWSTIKNKWIKKCLNLINSSLFRSIRDGSTSALRVTLWLSRRTNICKRFDHQKSQLNIYSTHPFNLSEITAKP